MPSKYIQLSTQPVPLEAGVILLAANASPLVLLAATMPMSPYLYASLPVQPTITPPLSIGCAISEAAALSLL